VCVCVFVFVFNFVWSRNFHIEEDYVLFLVLRQREREKNIGFCYRSTQKFSLEGGADPEDIYNLYLILKPVLLKSCQNLRVDIYLGYREN
jgi:hypothetical protein